MRTMRKNPSSQGLTPVFLDRKLRTLATGVLALAAALTLWCGQANAAIALLDTGNKNIVRGGGGATALSLTTTVSPGAKVLVVMLNDRNNQDQSPPNLLWQGQTVTRAIRTNNTAGTWRNSSIYYLFNPLPGSGNITGTFTATPSDWWISVYTLAGVNPTIAPFVGGVNSAGANTISFTINGVPLGGWAATAATYANSSGYSGFNLGVTVGGVASGTVTPNTYNEAGVNTPMMMSYASGLTAGATLFSATETYSAGGTASQKMTFVVAVFTPLMAEIPIVTALATNGAVKLSWQQTADGTNFVVQQATSVGGPYSALGQTTGTNWVDTTVFNGTKYYYIVTAQAPLGTSDSVPVSGIPLVAPVAPTTLVASSFDTLVNLAWTGSANASNYFIYRGSSSGGPYTIIHTNGTSTTYGDTAVVNGQTYYYVVSAVNVGGESPVSNQVIGKPNVAPSYLNAVGIPDDIQLDWTALRGATAYYVYRSAVSGGPYTLLATVTDPWYDDTPMPDGSIWYYVVSGQLAGGESANSPQAAASTPIQAPLALTATGVSPSEIDLAWQSGGIGATSYKIERSTDGVTFAVVGTTGASPTTFADTGLAAATGYYYRVRAANLLTNSLPSNVAWAPTWAYLVRVNFGLLSATDFYPGYLQDNGFVFGDRGNGYSYGWTLITTNVARERASTLSLDKRYDTLIHLMKPAPDGPAGWSINIPNGTYSVHLVGGDATAFDMDLQYIINDTVTDLWMRDSVNHWHEFTNVNVHVTNGVLSLTNGPLANNNKICFIDVFGQPTPLQIVSQPTNVSVVELTTTTLPVVVTGSGPITYRWFYNTNTLLSSQTNSTFVLNDTPMSAAGFYQLAASNVLGCITSAPIHLTMIADTFAPSLAMASGDQTLSRAYVVFSERVTANSAQDVANNYLAANLTTGEMLPLNSATLMADRKTVVLSTGPQTPGALYAIQVNYVTDISPQANPIAADSQITFQAWVEVPFFELTEVFTNIANGDVPSLTNAVKFQYGLADLRYYQTNFYYNSSAMPTGNLENYGSRSSGFFTAPSSGFYRFFLTSDDNSQLYMNTNATDSANPAGKALIAFLNGARTYYTNNDASMSTNIYLSFGQRYYMEALQKEGTGGDYLAVAYRIVPDGATIPVQPPGTAGGTPNIETIDKAFLSTYSDPAAANLFISGSLPSTLDVVEDDLVTLQCSASVAPTNTPLYFVWQRYDAANTIWTNIPGITGTQYSFYASLAEDQAQIRLTISTIGHIANFVTRLSVAQDKVAPFIVYAGCLDSTHILVRFNERVLPQYAGDVFNWQVNGGAAIINSATLRTNLVAGVERDYLDQVILTLATPISGAFWVDAYGQYDWAVSMNSGDSTITGTVLAFNTQDVGIGGSDPLAPGSAYPLIANGLDILAGGSDIWNAADGMYYVYRPISGNFDIKVRVNSLSKADVWSKAGLMARVSTNGNSQNVTLLSTAPDGQNTYTFQWRDTNGGASVSVNSAAGAAPFNIPPAGSNAWVRLKRVGPVFSSFISSNGVDWISFTNHDTSLVGDPYPTTNVLVGLAVTAHNNGGLNNMALAEFRDLHFPLPPTIAVQPEPSSQTVPEHTPVMISVAAESDPLDGPVAYQWQKDGVILPGATLPVLSLADPLAANSGLYTVSVGNDGGAVFSASASLTVTPTGGGTKATVVGFGVQDGRFWMQFNGTAGLTYRTLTTTNAVSGPWVELPPATVAGPDGLFKVTDTALDHSVTELQRYYKVVTP